MSEYYYQKIADGLIDEPEETPEILAEQQQIWDYMPLVKKLAYGFSFQCNLGYEDICQQGYYILAELTTKIDWQVTDVKMISSYVKVSVEGLLKNYCNKYSTIVSSPRGDPTIEAVSIDASEELEGQELNPEDAFEEKQTRERVRVAVAAVAQVLNVRETYVLLNHFADAPLSYRQMGLIFEVSYESIRRDNDRVMDKLRGFLQ